MKNIFKYKSLLALLILGGLSSSCTDDDLNLSKGVKPVVTLASTSFTITEGETANLTLNVDTPYKESMDFKLELVDGSGSNDDFSTSGSELSISDGLGSLPAHKIVFPANASSYTFDITAIADIYPESTETLTFKLTSSGNGNGLVSSGSDTINVTVANLETTNFTFRMEWDTTYIGTDDEEHHACDFDLDLEIYTSTFGGPVATSYGDCPEEIKLAAGDLADGDYWLVPSLWDPTTGETPATHFDIPAVLTFAKDGVWVESIDTGDYWNSGDPGATNGDGGAYLVKYVLTIAGTTYTVTDADTGSVIATGKMGTPTKPDNFVGGRQN